MLNKMHKIPLYRALKKYTSMNIIHFDVPGHKGTPKYILREFMSKSILEFDVSSAKPIDSIDNPKGPIKEAEKLMANAFSSDYSFFMVNGTTSAVQNMIIYSTKPKQKIILPRNIHKSVINGLILSGAYPIYVNPEIDKNLGISHGININSIKNAISNNKNVETILVVNPTYYGIASDIESIISIAHKNGLKVLCDEAHGSHFYFNNNLPIGCMKAGADLSSVSIHKTGGSLTQSSVLLCKKKLINIQHLRQVIDLMQTTSPSYLLLSSLDIARCLLEKRGFSLLEKTLELSKYARDKINKIGDYYVFGKEIIGEHAVHAIDETKLSIHVSCLGITGFQVYDILRDEHNIQVELADMHMIMAIVSIFDNKEKIKDLIKALKDIRNKYKNNKVIKVPFLFFDPEMIMTPREAFCAEKKSVLLKNSINATAGESIMVYPPGIPIVAIGEKITKEIIKYIEFLKKQECVLTGLEDSSVKYINILKS